MLSGRQADAPERKGHNMRVFLAAFGTRGDVQPMLALGQGLRERGHDVTLAAPPDFERSALRVAQPFVAMGESIESFMVRISDAKGNLKVAAAMREMPDRLRAHFRPMEPLVQRADVVAAAGLTVAPTSLAEKYEKRFHAVAYCPQFVPSAEHPVTFVKSQTLPQWLNRFSWYLAAKGHDFMIRKMIDEERARLGLPPSGGVWEHTVFQNLVMASDPALAPLPSDCPPGRVVQTGCLFLREEEGLAPDVEAFLTAGPPPVYIGFGSMPDADPARTLRWILDAAQGAGVRVLAAQTGAQAAGRQLDLPHRVKHIGTAPHGVLFPRCAAVIHHGGAGTTAVAARAGIPQIVVPHVTDQFFWAHRLERLGLAPPAVHRGPRSTQTLAAAILRCLDDTALRQRAKVFSERVAGDGVRRAIEVIESGTLARAP